MGVRRRLGLLLLLYTLAVGCWCPGAGQQLTSLLLGQSPALLLYHTFLSNLKFFLNKDTSLEALLIFADKTEPTFFSFCRCGERGMEPIRDLAS